MQNMWKTMHARGSRSIERCWDAIERISTNREVIEKLSRDQELSQLIHLAVKRCRDCDKKQFKSSTDKLSVEELSRLLKNSFSIREKHRYECNQACNSTNDLINILDSQNHLSIIILNTWIPKTHTHTQKTSLTNFIF